MAEQDMLNALDDCINRLADGQSLEDCLRRYPQYASSLRPMLEMGRLVNRARFTPAEIRESQDRVRFRVAEVVTRRARQPRPILLRTLPLVASLVIIFALTLGATGILAESSVPGDPLYGLKRFTETARLTLVTDRNSLMRQFDQRRIHEVEQLVEQRRAAEVTFQGELEAVSATVWQVAGLSVQVAPGTASAASAQLGDTLEVQASTTDEGEIVATSIRRMRAGEPSVLTPAPPTAIPSRTPSPTVEVTQTPPPTSSATRTPTRTPTSSPITAIRVEPSVTPCVPSQPQGWVEYRVQPNDSLSSLAAATGATLEELMGVNCLTDRGLIITGQRLYLPFEPRISATQTQPEVRSTEVEDRGEDNRDNSGPGSSNSGEGGGDDDGREEDDNSGRGSSSDDSGETGGSNDSGRGGGDD